jgi:hypothetical protein
MLSKCLNPRCSATFRYLRQGRLFRIDFSEPSRKSALAAGRMVTSTCGKADPIEHFWLCANCATTMTIELGEDGAVRPVPFENCAKKRAASAVPPMDRMAASAS